MRFFIVFIASLCLTVHAFTQENQKIDLKNSKDAQIFYNLGVRYANSGDIGSAILNFKRAGILNPGDKDTIYNLNKLRDSIGVPPYFFDLSPLEKAALAPFRVFSLNAAFVFGLVLFIIGSLGISLLLAGLIPVLFSRYLKILRIGFTALFCLGLVYITASWVRNGIDFDKKLCVVTQPSSLQDRPSGDSVTIESLPAGMEGMVRKEAGDYYLITVIDGHEGWTFKTNVTRIWEGIL